MKAVCILGREHPHHSFFAVETWRKRQLHNHACDVVTVVEFVNCREYVGLRCVLRELNVDGHYADGFCIFVFVVHIDARCRVITNEHRCKPYVDPTST